MTVSHIAVKELSDSDLTFFRCHFERLGKTSKQKAINLNADVFIDSFYPNLQGTIKYVFNLYIVGPGARKTHQLSRKVVRSKGSKNWRLNGELISDPENEPHRYDELRSGDFVVIGFEGIEKPESVRIVLVSAKIDRGLHDAILARDWFDGRRTMVAISQSRLNILISKTRDDYDAGHPLEMFLSEETIEDIVVGEEEPLIEVERELATIDFREISQEELGNTLSGAQTLGQSGEDIFRAWLTKTDHEEDEFEWYSRDHALAPYDFRVYAAKWIQGNPEVFVDVKTTRGSVEREFHMSISEIKSAARTPSYRIARIYALDDRSCRIRILTGVQKVAEDLLETLIRECPEGIKVDSVSIRPDLLEVEHRERLDLGKLDL
jgi:hypothetical protein